MEKAFTKAWFDNVRVDMAAALAPVGEKYGVKFDTNQNIKYDLDIGFHMRIDATVSTAGVDLKKVEWDKYSERFGLEKEHYGAELVMLGKKYRISGLNLRGRKNPVIVTDVITGKDFVVSSETITQAFSINSSSMDNAPDDERKRKWDVTAFMFGLKGVPWGAEFTHENEKYIAIELNPRASKYPVIARSLTSGVEYKFPFAVLKTATTDVS